MWGGVTKGLAGMKFSASFKRLGVKRARRVSRNRRMKKPTRSLYVK